MAAPLAEQAAGLGEVALLERLVHAGEVMAVLAEAHRHVEHRDVEQESAIGLSASRSAYTAHAATASARRE